MKQIIKNDKGQVIKVKTMNTLPSRTQQQFAEQTDVNKIMEKYKKRPDPAIFVRAGKGSYGDYSEISDYQSALHKVMDANDQFMTLPSQIRKRFDNNPQALLSFLSDDSNRDEAIKLGLINPPKNLESKPIEPEAPAVPKVT